KARNASGPTRRRRRESETVSWTLLGSATNLVTMLGIAGTRMLSESELIPVMAISKASKGHRAGRASLLVVSFIVGSSNGRPSGFSFARAGGWRPRGRGGVGGGRGGGGGGGSHARVSSSTSGDNVCATRA